MLVWLRTHLLGVFAVGTFVAALAAGYFLAPPECGRDKHQSDIRETLGRNLPITFGGDVTCVGSHAHGDQEIILVFGIVAASGAAAGFWAGTAKSVRTFFSFCPKHALLKFERIEMNRVEADPEHPDELYELVLKWKNLGRSAATVTRVGIGSSVGVAPPHMPMYRFFEGSAVSAVIEEGEEYVFRATNHMIITPDQRKGLDVGVVHQWLWGEIRYEDRLGECTESGFIAMRKGKRSGWSMRGPIEYFYTRIKPI